MTAAKAKAPAKKKVAAKKPAAKKAAAKKGPSKLQVEAKKILPKLKKGETTLSAERDRLGLKSNGPLRKALTEILGGKKAYQEMMAASRGSNFRGKGKGKGKPKGGKAKTK